MNIKFHNVLSERLYPIGYQFTYKKGKQSPSQRTITDYAITHNRLGQVVKFEYVTSYDFLGQPMTANMVQASIDLATNNGWKALREAV